MGKQTLPPEMCVGPYCLYFSSRYPSCFVVNIVNATLAFAWINWFVEAHHRGSK